MKTLLIRQRGIAALELALLMTATVFILIPTFVIAHGLWQYTVLKQATDNAARYIAALPPYQLNSVDPDPLVVAKHMVSQAVIEAGMLPASEQVAFEAQVEVSCPLVVACRSKTPDTVVVGAYMTIVDPASLSLNGSPLLFQTISTVPYGHKGRATL